MFVPEEGYQDRVAPLRTIQTMEILRVEVEHIFKGLISKLSHPEITIENSLEILLQTCKKYMIPDDTVIGNNKRSRPFRISARPASLCASSLWTRVRNLGIAMTITEFTKKVGISRSTIIEVNKQLDPGDIPSVELKENKQEKLKKKAYLKERQKLRRTYLKERQKAKQAELKEKRKLDKTKRKLNQEIRKAIRGQKKERTARLKAEKEKERLLDELDFQRVDRATKVNKIMSGKSVKELRRLAKIYNAKGRSKAKTKDDLIRLLDENYAERKQAAYERGVVRGMMKSERTRRLFGGEERFPKKSEGEDLTSLLVLSSSKAL